MRKAMVWTALLTILTVKSAVAQTMFGAEAYGSSNQVALGSWASELVQEGRNAGALTNDPSRTPAGGGGVRLRGEGWMASLDYERLPVALDMEAGRHKVMGDFAADVIEANVGLMLGRAKGFAVGFGGGVSLYNMSGGIQQTYDGDLIMNRTIEGAAVGGQFMGMVECNLGGQFSLLGAFGQRSAKLEQPTSEGVILPVDIDYSGSFVRVGIATYFSR